MITITILSLFFRINTVLYIMKYATAVTCTIGKYIPLSSVNKFHQPTK